MISFLAGRENYWRHLAPIAAELERRGVEVAVWAENAYSPWGPALTPAAAGRLAGVVVVASFLDAQAVPEGLPVVYCEHGAGQTYRVASPHLRRGFAGGPALGRVGLFCCPSRRVAALWEDAYPQARTAVIGAPALDWLRSAPRRERKLSPARGSTAAAGPLVAVTSHWPMGGLEELPEGMPALPHFERALARLAGVRLLGHAHPRHRPQMQRLWERLGVPFEADPDRILQEADLLIADNTSLLYEAAAADLPSLCLNAPWYRREVEHGLRFWAWPPGLQVDHPANLEVAVRLAVADPPAMRALRARAREHVYDRLDGLAASRAADAILEGVPMPPAPPSPEIRTRLDEVVERLSLLGASDGQIADLREQWDEMGDDVQRSISKMNDVRLREEIFGTALDEIRDTLSEDDQAELEAAKLADIENAEADEQALELLGFDLMEIVRTVGDDVELAGRLSRLEQATPDPRPELLEALDSIMDDDGE